jgi:hypothetical protein
MQEVALIIQGVEKSLERFGSKEFESDKADTDSAVAASFPSELGRGEEMVWIEQAANADRRVGQGRGIDAREGE